MRYCQNIHFTGGVPLPFPDQRGTVQTFFLRVKAAILRVRDLKSCGLKLRVGDEPATQPATRKSDVLLLEPANLDEKVAA